MPKAVHSEWLCPGRSDAAQTTRSGAADRAHAALPNMRGYEGMTADDRGQRFAALPYSPGRLVIVIRCGHMRSPLSNQCKLRMSVAQRRRQSVSGHVRAV